ncbi:NUDIX domain-containing protein [Streptomyces sp. NPDC005525]|uniref:NUDIX domain-containing protein n=1 Tax=Streptomyces sp. NPDC005525 TaxID=3364720 RepID=UPI003680989A
MSRDQDQTPKEVRWPTCPACAAPAAPSSSRTTRCLWSPVTAPGRTAGTVRRGQDVGETMAECVVRELLEETGVRGRVVELMRIREYIPNRDPGFRERPSGFVNASTRCSGSSCWRSRPRSAATTSTTSRPASSGYRSWAVSKSES